MKILMHPDPIPTMADTMVVTMDIDLTMVMVMDIGGEKRDPLMKLLLPFPKLQMNNLHPEMKK